MTSALRCCICHDRDTSLEVTTDLPGSGFRCTDHDACRRRVHDIVTAHKALATACADDVKI